MGDATEWQILYLRAIRKPLKGLTEESCRLIYILEEGSAPGGMPRRRKWWERETHRGCCWVSYLPRMMAGAMEVSDAQSCLPALTSDFQALKKKLSLFSLFHFLPNFAIHY